MLIEADPELFSRPAYLWPSGWVGMNLVSPFVGFVRFVVNRMGLDTRTVERIGTTNHTNHTNGWAHSNRPA
ncbi:hypothetical protein [Phenylobacterium sp.]|uniref:hypothetical protein n=1 Tax=Phenylobacterium sp. TaxID=1871053 RepID=UPI00286DF070|nr:hypothetical protein [Phenylobacterium sp.]